MSSSKPKKLEGNPDANLTSIGNYLFQKTVGEGNFAKVKLAKHKLTGQEVAVKIIDKTSLDEKKLSKLYREVRIMKLLHHPNIVKLYEVIETKHTIFLVMEYVSGGELYDYLVVHGRMKEKEARAKFRQIISAVSYCHKKRVIHRDLKAENLLLDHNLDIKIADFGFSNQFDPDGKLDTFCGSPPYAAPELFQGKRYTGPEVDVWSLGVILYVLTTGCLPFDGKNLQEMRESVCRGKYRIPFYLSETCEKLLRKFLVRDPTKRPALDILVDDPWLNEGYDSSPITQTVPEQLVTEDPLILNIMETKFGVERDVILKGLREDVFDDTMAIYALLWNEKQRNGEPAVLKISEQMSFRSAPSTSVSPVGTEASRAPVAAPPQAATILEEEGSSDHVHQTATATATGDVKTGAAAAEGTASPVPVARSLLREKTKTNRRATVGGEEDVKKMSDDKNDDTEILKKLKELQLKDDKTSNAVPPVVSRIREESSSGGRPRPISVAVPNEAFVPHSVVSELKAGENAQSDSGSTIKGSVAAAAEKLEGRKRTNTITGLLKIRPRALTNQPASPTDQPTDVEVPGSPLVGQEDESQASIAGGAGSDQKPRSLRFTFNSNTTSSKLPDDIMQEVTNACQKHNIKTRLISRYLLECTAPPVNNLPGAEAVKIEIEVCKLPRLKNLHGLRFKRTTGSSADYKTVSEQILAAVQL